MMATDSQRFEKISPQIHRFVSERMNATDSQINFRKDTMPQIHRLVFEKIMATDSQINNRKNEYHTRLNDAVGQGFTDWCLKR
jgi:hypothetical protein